MKTLAIAAVLALVIPFAGPAHATDVTVDPAKITVGYMNVFDLGLVYQWGSGWALADLPAFYTGSDLTLAPNSINDPNPYWYLPVGGPGSVGQKIMEAISYAEETGPLAGQTVNFNGVVLSNTLTPAHTAVAFIRDFAPDFSSFNESAMPLTAPGPFTLTLATVPDPARHVQYGFRLTGVCVWITDVGPYGTIVIGPHQPVPTETTSWGQVKGLYR
jgi:hypothetical protein